MERLSVDDAVTYLTAHPDEIPMAWTAPREHKAGVLFDYATPSGKYGACPWTFRHICGCLTQIRDSRNMSGGGQWVAWTQELTKAIREDDRIPSNASAIEVKHLPVFAEWQKRFRAELEITPTSSQPSP